MVRTIIVSAITSLKRRERIRSIIPQNFDWKFLDATMGRQPESIDSKYLSLIANTFWGDSKLKPGAIGCFISHYRVWEECVSANYPVLVLEDDVLLDSDIENQLNLHENTNFDVIFLNQRSVRWMQLYQSRNRLPSLPARPFREVISGLVNSNIEPGNKIAPGTDCYMVTPKGAKAMIEIANLVGTKIDVDWFMLGCAIAGEALVGKWHRPILATSYFPSIGTVNIGVANKWIAYESPQDVGGSILNHNYIIEHTEYISLLNKDRAK